MLRPGGMMLYSTCTFSSKENEENVDWILKQHPQLSLADIRPYEGFSRVSRRFYPACGFSRGKCRRKAISWLC